MYHMKTHDKPSFSNSKIYVPASIKKLLESREKSKRYIRTQRAISISAAILGALAEAGKISIQSFFPHPYSHLFCEHKQQQSIRKTFDRLHRDGLLGYRKNSSVYYLTKKGEKEAFLANIGIRKALYQKEPKAWDQLWRIVTFDIPERWRNARDYLRTLLKGLGFHELHKSVWITPYPIPDFLRELLYEEGMKHFTRIISVNEMDPDDDLRARFGL